MFIPRTLSQTEASGRGAWARAAIVGGFVAVAIFTVLSVNISSGEVNLSAGDVAQDDITAPRVRPQPTRSRPCTSRSTRFRTSANVSCASTTASRARCARC